VRRDESFFLVQMSAYQKAPRVQLAYAYCVHLMYASRICGGDLGANKAEVARL
jgi:hypothetical protein